MEKKQAKKVMLILGILGIPYSLVSWLGYKGNFPLIDILWLGGTPICSIYCIYLGLRKETPK